MFGVLRQRLQVGPKNREINFKVRPADADRGRAGANRCANVAIFFEALADLLDYVALGIVAGECLPRGEREQPAKGEAPFVVWRDADVNAGVIDAAHPAGANGREHDAELRHRAEFPFDVLQHVVHGREAGSLRRGESNLKFSFVGIGRGELLPDHPVERKRGKHRQRSADNHQHAVAERQSENRRINPIDPRVKTTPRLRALMSAGKLAEIEQPRAHHGREGEGDQQAYQHGHRGGEAELKQEPPRDARHERDGHKDDHQAEGGGQDRSADLLRRCPSRLERVHFLLLDPAEDILEHHNRVVDDDADHQHQRQHRDAVERKIQSPHHAESGDDGGGDGHRGNQGRAPTPHKAEHDQAGEDASNDQVRVDFVECLVDVAGLVLDHFELHVGRQLRRHLRQLRLDGLDHRDRVRVGLALDLQRYRGTAIEPGQRTLFLGAILGPANVADTDRRSVASRDDQVVEFPRGRQPAHGAQGLFA